MKTKHDISVGIPSSDKRSFLIRVKEEIQNEPVEYNNQEKLFVISDIEGNFKAFCKLLIKANVIDTSFRWTFENGHLIIVGDCFDRGEEVTECLWLIYALEEKARRRGGYVHFILGNHEIMNLNGDWRYVHPKYAANLSRPGPSTALYGGNTELWKWLCSKNIIEKVGKLLFVHGGISTEFAKLKLNVHEINSLARPYYSRAKEAFDNVTLSLLFNSMYSPFWYRGYYTNEMTEDQIDSILVQYDVKMIITGHTQIDSISSFFNKKVINVNTNHATENSQALLIKGNTFYRVQRNGNKEKLK